MMNMECYKELIKLYESKRIVILAQRNLFRSENIRSTHITPHLRDDNWLKEYPRSWIN